MPRPWPTELRQYLIDWPLPSGGEAKHFFETTHRTCSPEETLARLLPYKQIAGISRLSDITYLDHLGIPTYLAVRPIVDHYQYNISVYNGKGLTKIQAKASALMEAMERYSGERHQRPALLASHEEIQEYGRDLFSGEVKFIPAASAFFPYLPEQPGDIKNC